MMLSARVVSGIRLRPAEVVGPRVRAEKPGGFVLVSAHGVDRSKVVTFACGGIGPFADGLHDAERLTVLAGHGERECQVDLGGSHVGAAAIASPYAVWASL